MEDSMIIALYWERNERAIQESDTKYHPYCYKIAHNILEEHEDSEECVNDTWLRAWNSMPPDRPGILSAFLGRIARNLAFDVYRKKHAERRSGELNSIDFELDDCGYDSTDDQIDGMVTAQIISDFLRKETAQNRLLFVRRYWYADSVKSIADRFHMSESKVKTALCRTRKRLAERLEREGVGIR